MKVSKQNVDDYITNARKVNKNCGQFKLNNITLDQT